MNCNFYKTICNKCDHEFAYPLLSNFAYGAFIFTGTDGATFRYLSAFDNEAWDEISEIIKSNGLSELDKNDSDVDFFQRIVGSFIDDVKGNTFSPNGICPNCKSSDLIYSDNELIENRDIPIASFKNFSSMDELEQTELVISKWNAFKSR